MITHIFARESEDEVHTKQFRETLDAMKNSERLGKQIISRIPAYAGHTRLG